MIKRFKFICLFCLSFFTACTPPTNVTALQEKLETTEQALQKAKEEIAQLETQIEPEGDLVHLVFFRLKPTADQEKLVAEVKKLAEIKEVLDLEIGPFENFGDARALSDYSMLMQMSFVNKAAYERYQQHPIHLALKTNTANLMAGPPATYDFLKR